MNDNELTTEEIRQLKEALQNPSLNMNIDDRVFLTKSISTINDTDSNDIENSSDNFQFLSLRSVLIEAKNKLEGYWYKKIDNEEYISKIEIIGIWTEGEKVYIGLNYRDIKKLTYRPSYSVYYYKFDWIADKDSEEKINQHFGEKIL